MAVVKTGLVSTPRCQSRFRSIWWTWFFVTSAYLAFYLVAATSTGQTASERSSHLVNYVATGIGMFVPFGIWNFLNGVLSIVTDPFRGNPLRFLSLPAAVLLVMFAERRVDGWKLSCSTRLLVNLGVLLVVTLAVDLLNSGSWNSLRLLMLHDVLGGCC